MYVREVQISPFHIYVLHAMCECGGEFEHRGGITLASWPPKYTHDCNKCGRREIFDEQYPVLEYEPVVGDSDKGDA